MKKLDLFPRPGEKAFVAVSGGIDSQVLLKCLVLIIKKNLEVIHFHHGTRSGQDKEMALVKKYCNELDIPFHCVHLKMKDGPNFEKRARDLRHEWLTKISNKKGVVYTAHHLDDAFESSLMAQSRSSSLKATLGIPVINGQYRRPFLCLTKNQIIHLSNYYNVPFLNDPTNRDNKHLRNYWRNELIPLIKQRHPKSIKHFVNRSKSLAQKLDVSVMPTNEFIIKKDAIFIHIFRKDGSSNFEGCEDFIYSAILELSNRDRGSIAEQINKVIVGTSRGSNGPYVFSGGVKAVYQFGVLSFYKISDESLINTLDEEIAKKLEEIIISEFKIEDLEKVRNPYFCLSNQNYGPAIKKEPILWPKIFNSARKFNMNLYIEQRLIREVKKRHFSFVKIKRIIPI